MPVLDLRPLAPAVRHGLVYEALDALAPGEVLQLVNDHKPSPLRYELEADRSGPPLGRRRGRAGRVLGPDHRSGPHRRRPPDHRPGRGAARDDHDRAAVSPTAAPVVAAVNACMLGFLAAAVLAAAPVLPVVGGRPMRSVTLARITTGLWIPAITALPLGSPPVGPAS